MNLDIKLKFNFNKRNRYKNICSIEGCNNRACGKMTASDYTHLFGYLNPYYRSAYNIPKRRK